MSRAEASQASGPAPGNRSRAQGAPADAAHTLRGPAASATFPSFFAPLPLLLRPVNLPGSLPPRSPRGHWPVPLLPWAAHRLHTLLLLLLLPQPGAWHRGPLPDARPSSTFRPASPPPLPLHQLQLLCSLAPLGSPRLRAPRPAPAAPFPVPSYPVPKVGERVGPCPHHGTARLARTSLHPGGA